MSADTIRIDQFISLLDTMYKELWNHSETLEKQLDSIDDMDSDEYKFKEIEDISNNGKILATQQIMSLANAILLGIEKE
jgi:hypothetical protein